MDETAVEQKKKIPDTFRIELAGLQIELTPKHKRLMHAFCRKFFSARPGERGGEARAGAAEKAALPPDLRIQITDEDLEREDEIALRYRGYGIPSPFGREKMFVYRQIAEALPMHEALLVHAAAVIVDGSAYLFAGPSGVGKSTHAQEWKKELKKRMRYINDDKPLLKVTKKHVLVCGSPWCGKEGRSNNLKAPLAGIVFLHQAQENRIRRLTHAEAWPAMLGQAYLSKDAAARRKTMELVRRIMEDIPAYALESDASREAFCLSYEALTGKDAARLSQEQKEQPRGEAT